MKDYQSASPKALQNLDPQRDIVIDVRTKAQHDEKHLRCDHFHIPLDGLDPQRFMKKYNPDNQARVYLLCGGGTRARKAADKFFAAGYENLKIIEGGLRACEAAGYPIEKSNTEKSKEKNDCPVSLERQVRITAGALVFISTLAAIIIHPIFLTIPLFVGGGLIFSGLTDRCAMALLLTKTPWNKCRK